MSNQPTAMTSDDLYRSAVILCDPAAASRPRQWKHRAKILLGNCTAATPGSPKAHALLAYVFFQYENYAAAEDSVRKALRVDSGNPVYLRFFLALLLQQEKTRLAARWLRKLSEIEGLDLSKLRLQLRAAHLPTDTATLVLNAFPNAIGWFESFLSEEAEEIRFRGRDKPPLDLEFRQDIDRFRFKKIDARKVAPTLRQLIPAALEWGIGDDAVRGALLKRASTSRKHRLRQLLTVKVRRQINDWLDGFGDKVAMPDEAACFMYLLLAYEELAFDT